METQVGKLGFDLVVRSNPFGLLICKLFFFARFEVVTATLLDAWGPKIVLVKLTFLRWGGVERGWLLPPLALIGPNIFQRSQLCHQHFQQLPWGEVRWGGLL